MGGKWSIALLQSSGSREVMHSAFSHDCYIKDLFLYETKTKANLKSKLSDETYLPMIISRILLTYQLYKVVIGVTKPKTF